MKRNQDLTEVKTPAETAVEGTTPQKRGRKTAVIVALFAILLGLLLAASAFAIVDFDITKLNTAEVKTSTYVIDGALKTQMQLGETYLLPRKMGSIVVDCVEADVRLIASNGDEVKVVCKETDKVHYTVEVENRALTIRRQDDRKWYEKIGFHFVTTEINIYLPVLKKSQYEELTVKTVSGDVEVPEALGFNNVELRSTSGDLHFLGYAKNTLTMDTVSGDQLLQTKSNPGTIRLKTTSGNIMVRRPLLEKQTEEWFYIVSTWRNGGSCNLTVETTSGDLDVIGGGWASVIATTTSGDMRFSDMTVVETVNIHSTSGDLRFDRVDAGNLCIRTVSGDVEGLLTGDNGYRFVTNTTSGDVKVPDTKYGAVCEVTTTSGDIRFEVEK